MQFCPRESWNHLHYLKPILIRPEVIAFWLQDLSPQDHQHGEKKAGMGRGGGGISLPYAFGYINKATRRVINELRRHKQKQF